MLPKRSKGRSVGRDQERKTKTNPERDRDRNRDGQKQRGKKAKDGQREMSGDVQMAGETTKVEVMSWIHTGTQ